MPSFSAIFEQIAAVRSGTVAAAKAADVLQALQIGALLLDDELFGDIGVRLGEVVLLDALLIDGDRVPYCLGPAGVEVAEQRVELAGDKIDLQARFLSDDGPDVGLGPHVRSLGDIGIGNGGIARGNDDLLRGLSGKSGAGGEGRQGDESERKETFVHVLHHP